MTRNRASRHSATSLLAVSLPFISLCSALGCLKGPEVLSLEETIGLAMRGLNYRDAGGALQPYLDPRAKVPLMKLFADLDVQYHKGAFGVMGMLGESEEDVLFVKEQVLKHAQTISGYYKAGRIDSHGARVVIAYEQGMAAIAVMARNGAPSAQALLDRMGYPEYWRDKDIELGSIIRGLPYEGMFYAVSFAATLYPEEYPDVPSLLAERFDAAGIAVSAAQAKRFRDIVNQYGDGIKYEHKEAREMISGARFRQKLREGYTRFMAGSCNKDP